MILWPMLQFIFRAFIALIAMQAFGQTTIDVGRQGHGFDFSTAPFTRPATVGNSLPSTCTPGQLFFNTSATVGQNLAVCSAANLWTSTGTGTVTSVAGKTPVNGNVTLSSSNLSDAASLVYNTTQNGTTFLGPITAPDVIEGSPVIDARYVGVKCDGTTDDGPAISAAIAQAGAAGSTARQIKFPSGICRINSTIHVTVSHPWALIGETPVSGVNDYANSTEFLFFGGASPVLQFDYNKTTSIASISVNSNVATVTYNALPTANFVAGTSVIISGVPNGSRGVNFNGTFSVSTVSGNSLTFPLTATNDVSSGGTIASAFANSEYDGYVNHPTIKNITFQEANPTTNLANTPCYGNTVQYTPGSYGIQDWRSGSEHFDHVSFVGFDYPFYGIQTDLIEFNYVSLKSNHSGIYLGPRSDQAQFQRLYGGCNDTMVVVDGAQGTTFYNPVSDSNGIGLSPVYDIVQNSGRATSDVTFYSPWLENLNGNVIDSLIRVGYNASGSPVTGVAVLDPILSAASTGTSSTIKSIISDYYGDGLQVVRPKSAGASSFAAENVFKFYGSYVPSNIIYEPSYEHAIVSLYNLTNSTAGTSITTKQPVYGDPTKFTLNTNDDGSGGALEQFDCGTTGSSNNCTFRICRTSNVASCTVSLFTGNNTNTSYINLNGTTGQVSAKLFSGVYASSETLTYSATPTFTNARRDTVLILSGNVSTFTLAAGSDGQEKTLTFCQDPTGGRTVTPPSNVRGFFSGNGGAVGATASKCSSQHFTFHNYINAWLGDSPGIVNQ